MKIGDKVLCIKDYYSLLNIMFSKNKIYTIMLISDSKTRVAIENNKKGLSVFTTRNKSFYNFEDRFITQKEHRKLKLLKLNK